MNWREELRAQQAKTAAWIKAREADLRHGAEALEARGRQVYADALKKGDEAIARTPAEVRALGLAAVRGRLPEAVGQAVAARVVKQAPRQRSGPPQTVRRPATNPVAQEAIDQVLAGARGAQDTLTLGLGDRAYAGALAAGDALGGLDFFKAYGDRMNAERERDQYDSEHYKFARGAGEIAGTAAGLLALGPADALLAGGVRMAEAAPLVAREVAALGGFGGAGGVAGQAIGDFQRRELGSAGDYFGAAAGGATSALASTRLGPGQAGALGGAVTSAAQDVLNGRGVSLESAGRAGLAGGYLAAPFGLGGRSYSERLRPREKGQLGEKLGRIRTRINGGQPEAGGRYVKLPSGRRTVLDQESNIMPMSEQKFGRTARLSGGQREAYELFGPDDYRIDHFLLRDIGALYGYPMGQIGTHEILALDDR